MKYLKILYIAVIFSTAITGTMYALDKWYWTATRIGSVKNSSSFTPADCLNLTNITTDIYSNVTRLGQVAIGDIVYTDAALTTPLNGGSTWWAFKITDGGSNNVRGYKIDASGVIIDETVLTGHFAAFAYLSTTITSNCANTNNTTAIYAADDDPDMYANKRVYSSNGGATLSNASYTASYASGATSIWTFSTSASTSKIESLVCCTTNPISSAGSDALYNMTIITIPLNGFGFDCNGTVTYAWSRISGPNTPTINDATSAITNITGFIMGTYVYRLTVTDNSSNVATDDVTITVYPSPLDPDPVKIPVNLDQVYGMEGEDYRGVYGSSWNYYDAGTCDPRNGSDPTGKYDFDSVTAGWQSKTTNGAVQRLTHDYFRDDLPANYKGRGVLTEFDTVKYIVDMYVYDSTQSAGLTIKFYMGNKTKARQARWQQEFGDISPDYTYTTSATKGWYHVSMTGQDSAQYVYAVFSNFAVNVAIVLYGKNSPYNTSDTAITRRRYVTYTDTAGAVRDLHGANSAGALPLNNSHYFRDSLPYYFNGGRFYNAPFGSGSPLSSIIGMQDPDSVAWTTVAGSTNRIDIGPFGTGIGSDNPYITDSLMHRVDGFPILQNVRGTNGFYASHSGYKPEFKPKNDVASNIRTRACWERYAYMMECLVAKFYQTTSPPNSSKYRYQNDRWPAQFGLNFFSPIIEVDNEKDEGFRSTPTDSVYMRPEELFFQQAIVYDTLKTLQSSLVILTQAYVSYNISPLRAFIKNAYLYNGSRRVICDGISMHSTICYENYDHTPTSTELCGQHGDFPGTNNERSKMQNYILDIDREFGRHVPWYLTEWGYTKDSIGPTDCSGFTDASYSLIGAPQVKSYTKYQNHAILNWQALIHYAGVQGLKTANYYTIADAGDTGSVFNKNADFTNGITNYAVPNRILHPAYWYSQSFIKRFVNYKFHSNVSNVSGGVFVDKWVCRSNADSVIYIVFNQGRNDAGSTTTLPVGVAMSCTKWQPSFTSFNMTPTSQSLTGTNIVVTARPEGDVYSFYDISQASYFLLGGNKKVKG